MRLAVTFQKRKFQKKKCGVTHRDGLLSFIGPKPLPTPGLKPYFHHTHSYSPNILTPPEDSLITNFPTHPLISHPPHPPTYHPLPHRTLEKAEEPREIGKRVLLRKPTTLESLDQSRHTWTSPGRPDHSRPTQTALGPSRSLWTHPDCSRPTWTKPHQTGSPWKLIIYCRTQ